MNKTDLIAAVATAANVPKKDAEAIVNATLDTILRAMVAGDKVQLMGFGSFEVKKRAARTGVNPVTKQPISISEHKTVSYKPGRFMRDAVNARPE